MSKVISMPGSAIQSSGGAQMPEHVTLSECREILLLTTRPDVADAFHKLFQADSKLFQLKCIEDAGMAKARLRGGGIDVLLLDLTAGTSGLTEVGDIIATCTGTPAFALCSSGEDRIGIEAVRAGAEAYWPSQQWTDVPRLLKARLAQVQSPELKSPAANPATSAADKRIEVHRRQNWKRTAVMGVQGGTGATTLALNLAAVAAVSQEVILAEIRSGFGSLQAYFRPRQSIKTLSHILKLRPEEIDANALSGILWRAPKNPQLSILFAPELTSAPMEMDPGHVVAIAQGIAELNAISILDLPPTLCRTTQAALRHTDVLTLVMDRTACSVEIARQMIKAILNQDWAPSTISAVVVNRSAAACPMTIGEIESELSMPIAGMVPPDVEGCSAAYRAFSPLVTLRPESLLSESYQEISKTLFY